MSTTSLVRRALTPAWVRPEALNVTTELLLQPLKSANRTPQPKGYRSKGFMAFTGTTLSAPITVPAGWYVPAYRFVNTLTGQDTGLVILPAVQAS